MIIIKSKENKINKIKNKIQNLIINQDTIIIAGNKEDLHTLKKLIIYKIQHIMNRHCQNLKSIKMKIMIKISHKGKYQNINILLKTIR